ncbi:MAG TPA: hypothetical protein H9697_04715 [Candidatus Mediterraneibacter faecavium]|uniref:Uncharacterized protein n=1 Tax=Candidatus Mediterraneibacter faecavium TaxID=2838668 RepID=A0A9D2Q894_9FIRM|nr:hypothetical protein [Candidatus Mediterraneibacter faecavium]
MPEEKKGKTYLWLEDRQGKAGYTFWKILMQQIRPDVIVESKKIVYDNSFDNLQVYQEQKLLKRYADKRKNVFLLGLICFEYILLEFDQLIHWIYAPEDDFLIKRSGALKAREALVKCLSSGEVDYKMLQEVSLYDVHLDSHNIEQLSAKLLFDLTRNTGFEVSKKMIGECWIRSCCEWDKRQEDDICGLDNNRLSLKAKMQSVYRGTSIMKEFSKTGLEVLL